MAPSRHRPYHWVTSLVILAAAGLHVAYFIADCPLDLAPDEAHYWDWSRHLDWSYYSKGPLVAYLIRGSCELLGPWSQDLIGNEMVAVRLPAVLFGSLLLASLYVLTLQVYDSGRLGLAVVALALSLPVITAGASLMTIDAPYTCCWGWALVAGHRAVFRRSAWAWLVAGLLIGLGILAKYTMVLWIPSLGCFLLTGAGQRRLLVQPGFWVMTGVAGLCCLPILVWNSHHGWVSYRHVSGLAGLEHQASVQWLGPLVFVGGQAALLLGFWFVAWVRAMIAHRPWKEPDGRVRYLWWMSAPMFLVFGLFSLKTGGGELNWPVTAYISGTVLTSAWLARQFRSLAGWHRRLTVVGLVCTSAAGVALTLLMHYSSLARGALAWLSGPPTQAQPLPLRRLDPTCRLRGWRTLAGEVDSICARLRAEGHEPILAGTGWSLPGELGFYCQGHPTVYCLGPVLGDRHSQYDFWRPNPLADPEHFRGRTVVLVGGYGSILPQAFRHVEAPVTVLHKDKGQPVALWTITVCRDYLGFPESGRGAVGLHY